MNKLIHKKINYIGKKSDQDLGSCNPTKCQCLSSLRDRCGVRLAGSSRAPSNPSSSSECNRYVAYGEIANSRGPARILNQREGTTFKSCSWSHILSIILVSVPAKPPRIELTTKLRKTSEGADYGVTRH